MKGKFGHQIKFADLIDDKNKRFNSNNNFVDYEHLLKKVLDNKAPHLSNRTRKVVAYRIVTIVVKTFLKHLIRDLIYKNEVFRFPPYGFAVLKVGQVFKKPKHYKFNPLSHGIDYSAKLSFSKDGYRLVGHKYNARFLAPWQKMLKQQVDDGKQYTI